MATKSVNDLVVERLSPIYPIPTDIGPDVGSAQELLKRWWNAEGNVGTPSGQMLYNRYKNAGAVGSSLQDLALDFWGRGLLKSTLRLPGLPGNYVSLGDSPALSVTGDLDLRARVALNFWRPVDGRASGIISKWDNAGAGAFSYYFLVSGNTGQEGQLSLGLGRFPGDATNSTFVNSGAANTFVNGTFHWIRVTWRQSDGKVQFFTSEDGTIWTQLGTDQTIAYTAIYDGPAVVLLGAGTAGGSERLNGYLDIAEIYNAGVRVSRFDSSLATVTGDQVPATLAQVPDNLMTQNQYGIETDITGFNLAGSTLSKCTTGLFFTGSTGDSATTPDSVASSVVGDLDLRVKATLTSWAHIGWDGGGTGQTLLSKWDGAGNQRSYLLRMATDGSGKLNLLTSIAGTATTVNAVSTVAVPFTDGQTGWVRAVIDVDNTAVGNDVLFYTSTDGITWTQLGATVTTAVVTAIFDSTAFTRIGSIQDGTNRLAGAIHYAEVRNGIAGAVVVQFDPTLVNPTTFTAPNTFVSGTGETWTINGTRWTWSSYEGHSALKMVTGAGNNPSFFVGGAVVGQFQFPVTPGLAYAFVMAIMPASSILTGQIKIGWYNAAGSFLSQAAGSSTPLGPGYGLKGISGVAPAGAVWAVPTITIPGIVGAGIVNYLDGFAFYVGNPVGAVSVSPEDFAITGSAWWWQPYSGDVLVRNAIYLPGAAGSYISTLDSVAVSIVGDIDLRARLALDDWTPATIQTIISNQSAGDPQRAWLFQVDGAGRLSFTWYPAGTTASQIQKNSTAAVGVADGSTLWVRVTLAVATGQVTFYTSTNGITWTPMPLPTAAGATNLVDTTSLPAIGARGAGVNDVLSGYVQYAEIRNGIAGNAVAIFNPNTVKFSDVRTPTTVPSRTGEVWTLNGSAWEWRSVAA